MKRIYLSDGSYDYSAMLDSDISPPVLLAMLARIATERTNQQKLKRDGKFLHSVADREPTDAWCLAVLGEEFGEVAREVNEAYLFPSGAADTLRDERLEAELVQVAAVCVAWLERIWARRTIGQ